MDIVHVGWAPETESRWKKTKTKTNRSGKANERQRTTYSSKLCVILQ